MEVSGEPRDPGPVDVVVPLKRLALAKSRLAGASAALPAPLAGHAAHRALVLALLGDTLAGARAARRVRRLVVVSAQERPDLDACLDADLDAEVVPDPGGGLNAALRAGAVHLRTTANGDGPAAVAALQADLPALRGDELDDALTVALTVAPRGAGAAFVADRHGTGTTLLVTAAGRVPDPRFGPGSAGAHRAAGAVALDGTWPGLRSDVDTPADLEHARALGCGPATLAWPYRLPAAACGTRRG